MATLADELLNDFEASGSEGEEDISHDFLQDDGVTTKPALNGTHKADANGASGSMELDDDEEEVEEDEEMVAATTASVAVQQAEDEEEAKARVEKMQLGGVSDVRSVAGLMKTLAPVMEVSEPHI